MFASQAACTPSTFISKSDLEIVERSVSRCIVKGNYPFSIVESTDLRRALLILGPEKTEKLFPKSASTTRRLVDQLYATELVTLKELLASTPHKLHLSFDLWTSPNRMALLGIVGHFLDKEKVLPTGLFGLPRIFGQHSSVNQATSMFSTIQQLSISNRIGFLQCDNVNSNNAAVQTLLDLISPDNSKEKTMKDAILFRVHCFGHIPNLTARSLLEGSDRELLKTLAEGSQQKETTKEEAALLERWRKHGPIGKLHSTVQFVRASPHRLREFERITKGLLTQEEAESFGDELFNPAVAGLSLKADNVTRWNSVFSMIERASKLKIQIRIFCEGFLTKSDKSQRFPAQDMLSTGDWVVLEHLLVLLEPIRRTTKRFEGNWINFPEVNSSNSNPFKGG